jgi:hypothetical protein
MPAAGAERTMKVQEVILRAIADSLKWWEAAELIDVSDRTLLLWCEARFSAFARRWRP